MTNSIITFLSTTKTNPTDDYIPYRNVKRLIQEKSAPTNPIFKGQSNDLFLMKVCSYRSTDKFRVHRTQWDDLQRPIPNGYLKAIGIQGSELTEALEADQNEFDQIAIKPLFAQHFIVRLMASFYQSKSFDNPLSEELAIEAVMHYAKNNYLRCCIVFKSIKTIFIEPCGLTKTIVYRPSMKRIGSYTEFKIQTQPGLTRLK